MSSPSHHALWNPAYEDRGARLTDVLIVLTGENAGELNNVRVREEAAGFTVTTMGTYADFLNESLAKYAHIWDLGYNTVIPPLVQAKYIDYLQNGGAAFMMGENSGFQSRNDSVCSLIGAAGGGVVTTGGNAGIITVPIVPEFLLVNSTPSVTFNAPAGFTARGTGTAITTGLTCAVMWKTRSLSNCVKGALVMILDVNFLQTAYLQSDFVHNLIAMLNRK